MTGKNTIPTTNWAAVEQLLISKESAPDLPEPSTPDPLEQDWPDGIAPWDYKLLEPDNPLYPLPKNYASLSPEDQKAARLKAVCTHDTPLQFVAAWDTFRRLYLMTTPPGFFYHNFAPSPQFHYEMVYNLGAYGRNLAAAPRGHGKSVVLGKEIVLFLALTRPYIRIALCLATKEMVEDRFEELMMQLSENEAIVEDFGPQKPGVGKSKTWNKHLLKLSNGAKIQGLSVIGRKRGARPDIFILDDPEYDDNPNADTAGAVSREKFEVMMFNQVIPMLEKGSSIAWIGTIVGERSFLSHAISGNDERFKFWHTRVYDAGDPEDGNSPILWESKYDRDFLKIRRNEMGAEAFDNEYRNRAESTKLFTFSIDQKKNFYDVNGQEDIYRDYPLVSDTMVSWYEPDPLIPYKWVRKSESAREFFSKLFIIVTVDIADTVSRHSDFSCVCVSGFDRSNTLWLLDMWLGRAIQDQVLEHIFRLGWKWKAKVVGIESVSTQIAVLSAADTLLKERQVEGWAPRVVGIDYSGCRDRKKKGQRIRTLGWRFPRGKIKMPWQVKTQWPWSQLIHQMTRFTEDLRFLSYDDAVDAVAMTHYVIHGRGTEGNVPGPMESMAQRILAGNLYAVPGVPWLSALTSQDFSGEILDAFSTRAYYTKDRGTQGQSRKPRFTIPTLGRGRRTVHDTNRLPDRRSSGGPAQPGFPPVLPKAAKPVAVPDGPGVDYTRVDKGNRGQDGGGAPDSGPWPAERDRRSP